MLDPELDWGLEYGWVEVLVAVEGLGSVSGAGSNNSGVEEELLVSVSGLEWALEFFYGMA